MHLTLFPSCKNGNHESCTANMPPAVPGAFGGSRCNCPCHLGKIEPTSAEINGLKDAVRAVNEAAENVAVLGYKVDLNVINVTTMGHPDRNRLTLRVYKEL
jgi:hypothetical protein